MVTLLTTILATDNFFRANILKIQNVYRLHYCYKSTVIRSHAQAAISTVIFEVISG